MVYQRLSLWTSEYSYTPHDQCKAFVDSKNPKCRDVNFNILHTNLNIPVTAKFRVFTSVEKKLNTHKEWSVQEPKFSPAIATRANSAVSTAYVPTRHKAVGRVSSPA
ncbi:hypothetical protein K439DRAFT_1623552 [Ramaria rubella]|nr:hypothetical protein K439DRAFT_1623552 [Ramaria rubella]